MKDKAEQPTTDPIPDLVLAMLTVNNWSLDRSLQIKDRIANEQLFNLNVLNEMTPSELFDRLKCAGYAKSDYVVNLLVDRLLHMAEKLSAVGSEHLIGLLKCGRDRELDEFLLKIKGVGPSVLWNFKVLRRLRY